MDQADADAELKRELVVGVIGFQGRPSGLLRLARLAKVAALQRESLRVRDVAIPWARCTTCAPDDELETVLEKLSPASGMPIVVTDGQQLLIFP
ncbi:hypothetical protein AB0O67_33310 [Streptomyces sp. NPDC086077]|uniref:hypothetical protein n=1 Tax=Streptomyces sp. NPDC086077 TaxID=3154862 RepID=UPI003427A8B4